MSGEASPAAITSRIAPEDVECGFSCGKHSLDDYFARHALSNDRKKLGATYAILTSADCR
jgi:hypothetical protein